MEHFRTNRCVLITVCLYAHADIEQKSIGAVFYTRHTRHLFPKHGEAMTEEDNIVRAMVPVIYRLVLFSIVCKWTGVAPIMEKKPADITMPFR